jgi:hypothetical protein
MKCVSCGADVDIGDMKCHYCGTAASLDGAQSSERNVIFARIRKSPEFALEQLSRTIDQLPGLGLFGAAVPIGFLLFFGAVAIGMSRFFVEFSDHGSFGAPGFFPSIVNYMHLVPLAMGIAAICSAVGIGVRLVRIRQAPGQARPAVVVAKRTEVSGAGSGSSARTRYYATFEFETGKREELTVDRKIYGEIAEEDAGVLYTKAEFVAKFVRVL